MNIQYHYHATAMIIMEALLLNDEFLAKWGTDAPVVAAHIALRIARCNQMVDSFTPSVTYNALITNDILPLATQVNPKDPVTAMMLVSGDHFYPLMARGHQWHFDPTNGWDFILYYVDQFDILTMPIHCQMTFAVHLHTAQDCGPKKDGPHAKYVGWPRQANLDLARANRVERRSNLPVYARIADRIKQGDEMWGHAADPDADCIQNCREGAVSSAWKLFELFSDKLVYYRGRNESGQSGYVFYDEHMEPSPAQRIECLQAVADARNDHDLQLLSERIFNYKSGKVLIPYKILTGELLNTFVGIVA